MSTPVVFSNVKGDFVKVSVSTVIVFTTYIRYQVFFTEVFLENWTRQTRRAKRNV